MTFSPFIFGLYPFVVDIISFICFMTFFFFLVIPLYIFSFCIISVTLIFQYKVSKGWSFLKYIYIFHACVQFLEYKESSNSLYSVLFLMLYISAPLQFVLFLFSDYLRKLEIGISKVGGTSTNVITKIPIVGSCNHFSFLSFNWSTKA